MTGAEALAELYERKAFKPAPSLWELAHAHVPVADLGLSPAPEPRLGTALREGDGLALLMGGSGSGKSSVLASLAAGLHRHESGREYLPIFVPVAARAEHEAHLDGFGRSAIREVLISLRDGLPREYRERLERGAARGLSTQRSGARFNARLLGRVFGSGADVGVELAGDVSAIVHEPGLDNRGGVRTLGDVVRARGFELALFVEDTDAWASMPSGRTLAQSFFGSVLRPLTSDVDTAIVVAAQVDWERLDEFQSVRERATSVVSMPVPASREAALRAMSAVLDRRIAQALDDVASPPPCAHDLFTRDAMRVLATELLGSGSFRTPIAHVRDGLDRFADELPDRLDRPHLIATL